MLAAIGIESIDELFAEIPEAVALGPAAGHRPGAVGGRAVSAHGRAGRAQRRRRPRAVLPGGRHVRPRRAGRGRHDDAARRVPDRVHALPAGDEPGRAAGDLRVPRRRSASSPAWTSRTPPRL